MLHMCLSAYINRMWKLMAYTMYWYVSQAKMYTILLLCGSVDRIHWIHTRVRSTNPFFKFLWHQNSTIFVWSTKFLPKTLMQTHIVYYEAFTHQQKCAKFCLGFVQVQTWTTEPIKSVTIAKDTHSSCAKRKFGIFVEVLCDELG